MMLRVNLSVFSGYATLQHYIFHFHCQVQETDWPRQVKGSANQAQPLISHGQSISIFPFKNDPKKIESERRRKK